MPNEFNFPESIEPERPQMPPLVAAMLEHIHAHEPEPRQLEWANVMEPVEDRKSGALNLPGIRIEIQKHLNDGFSMLQMFRIKDGIVYWQGAREKEVK